MLRSSTREWDPMLPSPHPGAKKLHVVVTSLTYWLGAFAGCPLTRPTHAEGIRHGVAEHHAEHRGPSGPLESYLEPLRMTRSAQ